MPLTTDDQQTFGLHHPQTLQPCPPFLERPRVRGAIAALLTTASLLVLALIVADIRVGHIVDNFLADGPFAGTMDIYGAPRRVAPGDTLTVNQLIVELQRRGYGHTPSAPAGSYNVDGRGVSIIPSPHAHSVFEPCIVEFSGGRVARIVSRNDRDLRLIELEPDLITNVSDNRERRRLVRFADIPPRLLHAVISVEDKRFFEHSGFDLPRMLKAAYIDMKTGRKQQGASTLSMQLVRNFWLEPEKSWRRKVEEVLFTQHIERRLTKQKIFEYYANQIYLGRVDTFSISGFAEGARAFFGKDLSQLTIAEAALLAGLVQRPSYYNPFRYPDRALERRNLVLALMYRNGYLGEVEYRNAINAPVGVRPHELSVDASPYFVDLVAQEVEEKLDGAERAGRRVYTSLDSELQAAAEAAVHEGIQIVDRQIHSRHGAPIPPGQPQVALIALDPRTGEVKALVGGRNYRVSQLNHVTAMRQPGSSFKPFVYAAALNTAVEGGAHRLFTPASIVSGEAQTFQSGGKDYQVHNFHNETSGDVTLRYALAHSLNIAAVNVAAEVGFDKVVRIAQRFGLPEAIKPTPAVAIGAYEATPLQIASAYTAFANDGIFNRAATVSEVRASNGRVLYEHPTDGRPVLDPRVTYLMVNMMQEVLRSGTGAAARSMGVTQPAAGKTGTSRDGWFAGFTTELLCVVWVGFDDNRDLNLEGARSALPIWAEFMTRASKIAPYNQAKPFRVPAGVRTVEVCSESGDLATPYCPDPHVDVFIDGTEPTQLCPLHHAPSQPVDAGGEPQVSAPQVTAPPATGPQVTAPPPAGGDRDHDPGGA
jgi:penicillin-binding protein 1B